jgi:hypothetical protein
MEACGKVLVMRWPRRGILIRLAIYVPVISFLAWRVQGGCDEPGRETKDDELEKKLAPHRKVITLPDGTQQEVVELTQEEAEQILGHPIPRNLDEVGEEKAGGDAKSGGDAKAGTDATTNAKPGSSTASDAKPGSSAISSDAKAAEPRP